LPGLDNAASAFSLCCTWNCTTAVAGYKTAGIHVFMGISAASSSSLQPVRQKQSAPIANIARSILMVNYK
jgi:hypothetical protein